jgi:hypothetical protein
MSKRAHDVFVVVNFISNDREAKHVMIILFEVTNINGVVMAPKFQELLEKFFFTTKILTYVKDEGYNLQTYASALTFVGSCDFFALLKPFDGLCLGHALLNVCQYATIEEKVTCWFVFYIYKSYSICNLEVYYLAKEVW